MLGTILKADCTKLGKILHQRYALMGTSANKVNHILNNAIHWDTSLDSSGIIGEASDGYYWVGLLVKGMRV